MPELSEHPLTIVHGTLLQCGNSPRPRTARASGPAGSAQSGIDTAAAAADATGDVLLSPFLQGGHLLGADGTVPGTVGLALQPHTGPVKPLEGAVFVVAGHHVTEADVLAGAVLLVVASLVLVHVHVVVVGLVALLAAGVGLGLRLGRRRRRRRRCRRRRGLAGAGGRAAAGRGGRLRGRFGLRQLRVGRGGGRVLGGPLAAREVRFDAGTGHGRGLLATVAVLV